MPIVINLIKPFVAYYSISYIVFIYKSVPNKRAPIMCTFFPFHPSLPLVLYAGCTPPDGNRSLPVKVIFGTEYR